MRLTSAGEELLKIAVQMLDLYQQSKEKLTRQGEGPYRSGPSILWLLTACLR
ncbi:hypothetical protein LJK87_13915 [Paenibacillus sp. P25]|nr:hypothetical protein LJK87_13915 [Paenibacillus sp. P25]